MFATARVLSSAKCIRLLPTCVLAQESANLKLRKNLALMRGNIVYRLNFKRQIADKFHDKGKGDEFNYFLKLGNEQFLKLKKNRIKQIFADIQKLEEDIKKMEKQTSRKSQKNREKLKNDLKELKEMLKRFKKSLEKEAE
ncbi:uncharacterized protein LOC108109212 [Drosophila eugracilis]|uniref:uncharacterized protein LOC108109212 n=1 Tax=Drosophila eugracilis TaxID=29029 RepID=UPI0007E60EA3|nr:uncharacterized protein LOC108109212 [Drosophila eugracilis]